MRDKRTYRVYRRKEARLYRHIHNMGRHIPGAPVAGQPKMTWAMAKEIAEEVAPKRGRG